MKTAATARFMTRGGLAEPNVSFGSGRVGVLFLDLITLFLCALSFSAAQAQTYTWSTFAGPPAPVGSQDGKGSLARFQSLTDIATDCAGNVYVLDERARAVRKITPDGVVSTRLAADPYSYGHADGAVGDATFGFLGIFAVGALGDIYLADDLTIRKITPEGLVSTLAGSPNVGEQVDGTGSAARFEQTESLAVDAAGNVYVADNGTVRKVSPTGVVSTLAGVPPGRDGAGSFTTTTVTTTQPAEPVEVDGTGSEARFVGIQNIAVDQSGNIWVLGGNHSIRRITPNGVVTTPFPKLDGLEFPHGLAVDRNGILYVSDVSLKSVFKINPDGTLTQVAGTPYSRGNEDGAGKVARFNSPWQLAVHPDGSLYVADYDNHSVRKITPQGIVSTLAGPPGPQAPVDESGTHPWFSSAVGIVKDDTGNIYVADMGSHVIRKISQAGVMSLFAGSLGAKGSEDGLGPLARFNRPGCLALDSSNNLYVADYGNHLIRKVSKNGMVTTVAGCAGVSGAINGAGSSARFNNPMGVGVDRDGTLYVADSGNHTLRKITLDGVVSTLAGTTGVAGTSDGVGSLASFTGPYGVAVDGAGNVYVADSMWVPIRKVTPQALVTTLVGTPGGFSVALDRYGRPVVASDAGVQFSGLNGRVVLAPHWKGRTTGFHMQTNGFVTQSPQGVTVDSDFTIYFTMSPAWAGDSTLYANSGVYKVSQDGLVSSVSGADYDYRTQSRVLSQGGAGCALDVNGVLYVAGNQVISKILADGTVIEMAGAAGISGSNDGIGTSARFNNPSGVAIDVSGNIYVADTGNHTIRKLTRGSVVTTVAGRAGVSGSSDGVGDAVRFLGPTSLAFDKAGELYVADTGNSTIRKISKEGVVSTFAGSADIATMSNIAATTSGVASTQNMATTAANSATAANTAAIGNTAVTTAGTTITTNTAIGNASTDSATSGNTAANTSNTGNSASSTATGTYTVNSYSIPTTDATTGTVQTTTVLFAVEPDGSTTTGTTAQTAGVTGPDLTNSQSTTTQPANIGQITTQAGNTSNTSQTTTQAGNASQGTTQSANTVTTAATTQVPAVLALDGVGKVARFNHPQGLAVDKSGNVYVADTGNCSVRKITPSGVVTTLAGAQNAGLSGAATRDGVGRSAVFWSPTNIAADEFGNLFVTENHQIPNLPNGGYLGGSIRKVTPEGIVSTIGGGPAGGWAPCGGENGVGNASRFSTPTGIAVGRDGRIYVVDSLNNNIRLGTLNVPPSLTQQPAAARAVVGGSATLSVAVSSNQPVTYQWQKNGVNLANGTLATYAIHSAQLADAGSYSVVVSNAGGTLTSSAVQLTVGPPVAVSILTQPSNQTANQGGKASFAATVSGSGPIQYQWRKNGTPVLGATDFQLTLDPISSNDMGSYDVVVSNAFSSAASAVALLSVNVTVISGTSVPLIFSAPFLLASGSIATAQLFPALSGAPGKAVGDALVLSSGTVVFNTKTLAASGSYTVRFTQTAPGGLTSSVESPVFGISVRNWSSGAGNYEALLVNTSGDAPDAAVYRGAFLGTVTKTGMLSGRLQYVEAPPLLDEYGSESGMRTYIPVTRTFVGAMKPSSGDPLRAVFSVSLGGKPPGGRQELAVELDFSSNRPTLRAEVRDNVSSSPDVLVSATPRVIAAATQLANAASSSGTVNLADLAGRFFLFSDRVSTVPDGDVYILSQVLPTGRVAWTTRMLGVAGSGSGMINAMDPENPSFSLFQAQASAAARYTAKVLMGQINFRRDWDDAWKISAGSEALNGRMERHSSCAKRQRVGGVMVPVYSADLEAENSDGVQALDFIQEECVRWSGISTSALALVGFEKTLQLSLDDPEKTVAGKQSSFSWNVTLSKTGALRTTPVAGSESPLLSLRLDTVRGEFLGSYVFRGARRSLYGLALPRESDPSQLGRGWIERGIAPTVEKEAWLLKSNP